VRDAELNAFPCGRAGPTALGGSGAGAGPPYRAARLRQPPRPFWMTDGALGPLQRPVFGAARLSSGRPGSPPGYYTSPLRAVYPDRSDALGRGNRGGAEARGTPNPFDPLRRSALSIGSGAPRFINESETAITREAIPRPNGLRAIYGADRIKARSGLSQKHALRA